MLTCQLGITQTIFILCSHLINNCCGTVTNRMNKFLLTRLGSTIYWIAENTID